MSEQEEWRPVVGFEGLYEVSDHGAVRRLPGTIRTPMGGVVRTRVLKGSVNKGGYLFVQLWRDNKANNRLVHLLVVEAFIGPRPSDKEVNHINGNKADNRRLNLEYLTRSDNAKHAYRLGLRTPAGCFTAGVAKVECRQGHRYDVDGGRRKDGSAYCKACARSRSKARREAAR